MEAGAAYQPLSGAERQGVDYLTVRAAADASAANVNASAGAASVREPGGYGMPSMSESDRRAWELIREASMELEAQYEAQSNAMQSAQQSDALQQAVDIQTGNLDSYVSGSSYAAETADEPGYAYDEEKGLDTEAAARQARQMLAQGFEVDDIASAASKIMIIGSRKPCRTFFHRGSGIICVRLLLPCCALRSITSASVKPRNSIYITP